jgi:hypothetical protein
LLIRACSALLRGAAFSAAGCLFTRALATGLAPGTLPCTAVSAPALAFTCANAFATRTLRLPRLSASFLARLRLGRRHIGSGRGCARRRLGSRNGW